jgi:hypothetical protein
MKQRPAHRAAETWGQALLSGAVHGLTILLVLCCLAIENWVIFMLFIRVYYNA